MIFGNGFESLNPFPLSLMTKRSIMFPSGDILVASSKMVNISLTSFRRSANSIITILKKPNEQVLMKLLFTFSVPILTYASEVKQFSYADMNECNIALNDAIRRIFSFHRWESVRTLRQQFGYQDLFTIFALRRRNFFATLPLLRNQTILSLSNSITA